MTGKIAMLPSLHAFITNAFIKLLRQPMDESLACKQIDTWALASLSRSPQDLQFGQTKTNKRCEKTLRVLFLSFYHVTFTCCFPCHFSIFLLNTTDYLLNSLLSSNFLWGQASLNEGASVHPSVHKRETAHFHLKKIPHYVSFSTAILGFNILRSS